MNISPGSLHHINSSGTPVVVYHTQEQKAILMFSSLHKCANYLFNHRITKKIDLNKFVSLIRIKCCQKKQREELNIFALPFTYRIANAEQKNLLADADYLVLDERFKNEGIEQQKIQLNKRRNYDLEKTLCKGDIVEITDGKNSGITGKVIKIRHKEQLNTPGTKLYDISLTTGIVECKAHVLKFIKKAKQKIKA